MFKNDQFNSKPSLGKLGCKDFNLVDIFLWDICLPLLPTGGLHLLLPTGLLGPLRPRCRNQLKEVLPQIFVTVTDTLKTRNFGHGNTLKKHTRRNCFDDVIKR